MASGYTRPTRNIAREAHLGSGSESIHTLRLWVQKENCSAIKWDQIYWRGKSLMSYKSGQQIRNDCETSYDFNQQINQTLGFTNYQVTTSVIREARHYYCTSRCWNNKWWQKQPFNCSVHGGWIFFHAMFAKESTEMKLPAIFAASIFWKHPWGSIKPPLCE